MLSLNSVSEAETEAFVNSSICPAIKNGGLVLLNGDLGAGKTFVSRCIIRHFAENPQLQVTSPTFGIYKQYTCLSGTVTHFDLYRIKHQAELANIGFDELVLNSFICLIEWPDVAIEDINKISHFVKKKLEITIRQINNTTCLTFEKEGRKSVL